MLCGRPPFESAEVK